MSRRMDYFYIYSGWINMLFIFNPDICLKCYLSSHMSRKILVCICQKFLFMLTRVHFYSIFNGKLPCCTYMVIVAMSYKYCTWATFIFFNQSTNLWLIASRVNYNCFVCIFVYQKITVC